MKLHTFGGNFLLPSKETYSCKLYLTHTRKSSSAERSYLWLLGVTPFPFSPETQDTLNYKLYTTYVARKCIITEGEISENPFNKQQTTIVT